MAEEETPEYPDQFVITGTLYLDAQAQSVIQTPIGPFDLRSDAEEFMWKMRPFYGSWEIETVHHPIELAERILRPGAVNFLREKFNGRTENSGGTAGTQPT